MRWGLILLAVVILPSLLNAQTKPVEERPTIDVVFCIDCSGSMGGVIETAKQKVWAIVNQIARSKPAPVLRIGLIGYGNSDQTYRQFDLTDDLDGLYKNLLTFKDEGWGSEWVGRAVMKATKEMKWSPVVKGQPHMKVIYVVGNETAKQGPQEWDYTVTAPEAIKNGIMVNAIFCGDRPLAEAQSWMELAKLADGQYLQIAGQGGGIAIATPFDQELAGLSTKLNGTYVAYGARGGEGVQQQMAADQSSLAKAPASAADRALSKSSSQYRNSTWDLVDRSKDKDFNLGEIKEADLPEEMKKMTPAEREAHLKAKSDERAKLQNDIKALSAKRDAYIKEEIAKQGLDPSKGFDAAVQKSVTEQAEKNGFTVEK